MCIRDSLQHVPGRPLRRRRPHPLRPVPGRQRPADHADGHRALGAGVDLRLADAVDLLRADRRGGRRVPRRRVGRRPWLSDHPVAGDAQRRRHDGGADRARRDRYRHGARHQADRKAAAPLAAGVPEPDVKRWVWLTAGLLVLLGLVGLGTARLVGRRGSRASALIAVVTAWLAAWILWGFAGGLAAHYGALERYDGTLFT